MNGQQAVFTEGLHLGLQGFEGLGRLLEAGFGFGDGLAIALLLLHERRLAALQLPLLLLRLLKAEHLLL